MKNQLVAVDCATFIYSKVMAAWDKIDPVDYLVQSINIWNQDLYKRKN